MLKGQFKYILPTLFIGAQVFAQTSQVAQTISDQIDKGITKVDQRKVLDFCKKTTENIEEAYKTLSNSIWSQVLREINESDLDGLQIRASIEARPLRIKLGYDANSTYYSPTVHAGEDRFNLNIALIFPLFGSPFELIGEGMREIAYTRLYQTKCDSLVRLPYNPIKRMPVDAEKALALEDGELVSYSAPITFALGAYKSEGISSVGTRYFRTGDVNVNVFKMGKNLVRVRMISRQEKGFDFTAQVLEKALHVIQIGRIKYEARASSSKSELIDYIFDLSNDAARATYNKLVGPHNVAQFDIHDETKKAKVALSNEKMVKTLFIDENDLLEATANNAQNVTRVMGADIDMDTNRASLTVNFLNAIRLDNSTNYADSTIARKDGQKNVISTFFARSIESIHKSQFFSLASKDKYQLGTILIDNSNPNDLARPLGFNFQKTSSKIEMNDLLQSKWSAYLHRLPMTRDAKDPDTKLAIDIDARLKELRDAGRMRSEETFFVDAEEFFKIPNVLDYDLIKNQVREIMLQSIDAQAMLTAQPSGTDSYGEGNKNSMIDKHTFYLSNSKAWNALTREQKLKELEDMYSYELNTVIPQNLIQISNKELDSQTRLLGFNALMQTPLFNEIGINLLTRIIPAESLKKIVIYQAILESNNSKVKPLKIVYGDVTGKNYITGQNSILTKNFSLNPGSNLRLYLTTEGRIKSKAEVMKEAEMSAVAENKK